MRAWNGDDQMLAAHHADNVRGFPFSKEAARRLDRDRVAEGDELERRYEGLMGELGAIADRLEAIGQAFYMLAIRYGEHGGKALVVEGLEGAVPELADLADQVRTVRKAAEDA